MGVAVDVQLNSYAVVGDSRLRLRRFLRRSIAATRTQEILMFGHAFLAAEKPGAMRERRVGREKSPMHRDYRANLRNVNSLLRLDSCFDSTAGGMFRLRRTALSVVVACRSTDA